MGLQKLIIKKGISCYRLSKVSGVGESTISDLVNGKRKEPRISTCDKIAKALGVDVSAVYEAIKED